MQRCSLVPPQIQTEFDSGGSRIFPTRSINPKDGEPTYYLAKYFPKTA